MKILVLNAGSSSQKSALYDVEPPAPETPPSPLWQATISWHEQGAAQLRVVTRGGQELKRELRADARADGIRQMLETIWSGEARVLDDPGEIAVAGHRVVHGGAAYCAPTRVTDEVRAAIRRLAAFAPEHNQANAEGIEAVTLALGAVPQVAVFDTAFHASLPPGAYVYPGPYAWLEQGIRRYGFHGISYQYCTERAARMLGRSLEELRLIICHLGSGCSLVAIANGKSVDTTMGFTPLDGLMMSTRSGAVDPSILLYLLWQPGASVDALDKTLNEASGLLGISGISGDLREVLGAMRQGNERAALALDVYIHRLRSFIGAMLASLGGVDALVFTGGVGEHSGEVRAGACAAFGFLGLQLDTAANAAITPDADIATADSAVRVLVIHTEEDWMIARECLRLLTDDARS